MISIGHINPMDSSIYIIGQQHTYRSIDGGQMWDTMKNAFPNDIKINTLAISHIHERFSDFRYDFFIHSFLMILFSTRSGSISRTAISGDKCRPVLVRPERRQDSAWRQAMQVGRF